MKKTKTLLPLSIAALLCLNVSSVFGQSGSVKTVTTQGDVSLLSGDMADSEPLVQGRIFSPNRAVKTGPISSALLALSNGAALAVEEKSMVKVSTFRQQSFSSGLGSYETLSMDPSVSKTNIDLKYGSLSTHVELSAGSRYDIDTPVATAGIRGTTASAEFMWNPSTFVGTATFGNVDGEVVVVPVNGSPQTLAPGQEASISALYIPVDLDAALDALGAEYRVSETSGPDGERILTVMGPDGTSTFETDGSTVRATDAMGNTTIIETQSFTQDGNKITTRRITQPNGERVEVRTEEMANGDFSRVVEDGNGQRLAQVSRNTDGDGGSMLMITDATGSTVSFPATDSTFDAIPDVANFDAGSPDSGSIVAFAPLSAMQISGAYGATTMPGATSGGAGDSGAPTGEAPAEEAGGAGTGTPTIPFVSNNPGGTIVNEVPATPTGEGG